MSLCMPESGASVSQVREPVQGFSTPGREVCIPRHDKESLALLTSDPEWLDSLRLLARATLHPSLAIAHPQLERRNDWTCMRQLAQAVLALDALVARQDMGQLTLTDQVAELQARLSNSEADSRGGDPPRRLEGPLEGSCPTCGGTGHLGDSSHPSEPDTGCLDCDGTGRRAR